MSAASSSPTRSHAVTSAAARAFCFVLLIALAGFVPTPAAGEVPQSLHPVYENYFRVQKALASDDLKGAKSGFAMLQKASTEAQTSAQTGSAAEWNDPLTEIGKASRRGAVAGTLDEAREAFAAVSTTAVGVAEHYGTKLEVHVMFCPKAIGGAGATWMQVEQATSNPYLGKADLNCGERRKSLKGTDS